MRILDVINGKQFLFQVMWGADKASVRFLFAKDNTINWVGASIFVPFALVVASWFSCVYCYYKVATIIRGSQTVSLAICLSQLSPSSSYHYFCYRGKYFLRGL